MPRQWSQCHLFTGPGGGGDKAEGEEVGGGGFGICGGLGGSKDGFEHPSSVLLFPAEKMRTANPHALLPHQQEGFFGLLNAKPIHGWAVQHRVYKILNPPPLGCPG